MSKRKRVLYIESEEVIGLLTDVLKEPSGRKVNLNTRHQLYLCDSSIQRR